jgi:hypothetical protein
MRKPIPIMSVRNVQGCLGSLLACLRPLPPEFHRDWDWATMRTFVQELYDLADEQPLDVSRINDFTRRLNEYYAEERWRYVKEVTRCANILERHAA